MLRVQVSSKFRLNAVLEFEVARTNGTLRRALYTVTQISSNALQSQERKKEKLGTVVLGYKRTLARSGQNSKTERTTGTKSIRGLSTSAFSGDMREKPLKKQQQPKKTSGYEAFGSFHTPSMDELFKATEPPSSMFLPPLPCAKMTLDTSQPSELLGKNREHFTIDLTHWTYLNHGAFGGTTKYAAQVAAAWQEQANRQPLAFHDRQLFPYLVHSIKALAKFVHINDPQELVLVPNATSGLHAVLSSILAPKEASSDNLEEPVVLCFSTRYGAVRKMLQTMENRPQQRSIRVHEEPLSLAESYNNTAVLARLENALAAIQLSADGSKHKQQRCVLVVVDHITSNTGVVLPVKEIVKCCHAHGIPVLVDGAHGLLNLPLDVNAINADYYVGNCHKWLCAPRGAAFLHVNKQNGMERTRSIPILPRIVSHGYFDGFQSAFMWIGLQDYSPWLSLPKCIDLWQDQGVEATRNYMHSLAQEATELLYSTWKMDEELAEAKMFPAHKRNAMRLVKLPPGEIFGVDTTDHITASSADAKHIQDTLHYEHHVEVPIKCVDGKLYVRISAHVYNTIADYKKLAQIILRG